MKKPLLAILGLNRIGLSMLLDHANGQPVLGFDFSEKRIQQLLLKKIRLSKDRSRVSYKVVFTNEVKELKSCKLYFINVPEKEQFLDSRQLKLVKRYTVLVASMLKKGDWVFFASGLNNHFIIDTCMPLLEQVSGMNEQKDYKAAFTGIKSHCRQNLSFGNSQNNLIC